MSTSWPTRIVPEVSVTTVDLDLDVIRRRDGSIELLDVDEFEAHQVELAYPTELIDHAERTAQHLLAAVRGGVEPFAGSAAKAWMSKINRLSDTALTVDRSVSQRSRKRVGDLL